MIKFFRKIRQNLLMENKTSKYFKYALGEIFLVVIGILIALQINNWNENRKKHQLKVFYMNSIKNDLTKDTLDINHIIKLQRADNKASDEYLNRMLDTLSTIDTIINIAKNEYDFKFTVKREYANNTFNTLISTGNIELLDKELTQKLMDLNSIQQDQLERFYSHMGYFERIMSDYLQNYPIYDSIPENTVVGKILWDDIDEKQLVGSFTSILGLRKFMFKNSISGHLRVKDQSIEVLNLIDKLLEE
ncbi:DUF6090 family protein [Hanstruepera marina]|uniref:DUF6090 family protein n=1 Tax=Hanstruepera marina TaxID=2873265 RepID=UPI001CA620C1|nr:DUF6090 family protein [Hanstruepera marina]